MAQHFMSFVPRLSPLDQCLCALDRALRTVAARPTAGRPTPGSGEPDQLDATQRREAAALMRVNHVGEVCAQALYASQALFSRNAGLRTHFQQAASDELDHLAWTQMRLDELGDRKSLLTPAWYAGAFALGSLAGLAGDRWSLGFVVETERQVEAHLASHLDRLPASDLRSRAIVAQMRDEEARHADEAEAAGAAPLPTPVPQLMRLAARVMTTTAHYV